jgi:hypothetical protein
VCSESCTHGSLRGFCREAYSISSGWLIRYTHGAPCDGMFEQTDIVENIICLLLIIPWSQRNFLGSEQSIELLASTDGPVCSITGGAFNGKVNKLETSNWVESSLAVLSRICRLLSILHFPMREVEKFFNKIDGVPMWIQNWCKFLKKVVFKHYKPREETASASVSKRTRSIHSTNLWKKNRGRKGRQQTEVNRTKDF